MSTRLVLRVVAVVREYFRTAAAPRQPVRATACAPEINEPERFSSANATFARALKALARSLRRDGTSYAKVEGMAER
jgi:hypothetical protein